MLSRFRIKRKERFYYLAWLIFFSGIYITTVFYPPLQNFIHLHFQANIDKPVTSAVASVFKREEGTSEKKQTADSRDNTTIKKTNINRPAQSPEEADKKTSENCDCDELQITATGKEIPSLFQSAYPGLDLSENSTKKTPMTGDLLAKQLKAGKFKQPVLEIYRRYQLSSRQKMVTLYDNLGL